MKWKDTKDFVHLKVYETLDGVADKNGKYNFRTLDSYKEFDLLLITHD
jgi:hypothetical protein